ncbi:MAG: hypothetical protein H0X41_01790, partial [Chitinophagaceae bacterium]|nr:hypothetical protein [Chitinophagaceae bacterium]
TAGTVIDGLGVGCEFNVCSIIGGTKAIDNGSAVSVKVRNSVLSSAVGSNVTIIQEERIRRVIAIAQSATPTINSDITDVASITGLAQTITGITLAGTPTPARLLEVQITDNGTARDIVWGGGFAGAPPNKTSPNTILRAFFEWNSVTNKFDYL